MRSIRIRVRPQVERRVSSAEEILVDPSFSAEHVDRVRSYTQHERRQRADYHARRYLSHLAEDALHRRIGDMISNVVYVSHRNRYSTNTRFIHYWRDRLAETAEELAIRGSTANIPDEVLGHLPPLGFPIPSEVKTLGEAPALFRYDRLEYIAKLHREGEIYLRCASTEDPAGDVARNDSNELCISLSLLAEDLIFEGDSLEFKNNPKTVDLKINQKVDYFMFCLSRVYDWRLFGDFACTATHDDSQEPIACLLIIDPAEFVRRFVRAMGALQPRWELPWNPEIQVVPGSAFYYDPHDSRECGPLFEERLVLPFAKRRAYTYQHEYRIVVCPRLPEDFVPSYSPAETPRLQRTFLHLGSLEDISRIIRSDPPPRRASRFYLPTKDVTMFASALGVTLANAPERLRFTYSVESEEQGRTDAVNLTAAQRISAGSLQIHGQEIDVPIDAGAPNVFRLVAAFYKIFDVREHGNDLIEFVAEDHSGSLKCRYGAFLVCPDAADEELQVQQLSFKVKYSVRAANGAIEEGEETVVVEAEAYWAPFNYVGPLHLHPTHRSLLAAEMVFLDRLADRGVNDLVRYEVYHDEVGRCSEFEFDEGKGAAGGLPT